MQIFKQVITHLKFVKFESTVKSFDNNHDGFFYHCEKLSFGSKLDLVAEASFLAYSGKKV